MLFKLKLSLVWSNKIQQNLFCIHIPLAISPPHFPCQGYFFNSEQAGHPKHRDEFKLLRI